jgi:hypothetical protein
MANWSVTNTFSNSTTADATQVNTNFTDLISCSSDGTKDMSINALTCAGTVTLNGNVTLGNASGDDVTITGSLASTIAIKTNATYNIGSATLGLASVYLGSAGGLSTRLVGGATGSSWTLTFPTTAGSAKYIIETDGSGTTSFTSRTKLNRNAKSADYTIVNTDDYVPVDASGAARAITLLAASDTTGKKYIIQKTDSSTNAVTITRAGSDTINGATSTTLNTQYEMVEIISDGTSAWYITNRTYPMSWNTFTAAYTNGGTATYTTTFAFWRRVGDCMHVVVKVALTAGGSGGGFWSLTLPDSKTINSSVITSADSNVGYYVRYSSVAGAYNRQNMVKPLAGNTGVSFILDNTSNPITGADLINTDYFMINFTVPITGWSA